MSLLNLTHLAAISENLSGRDIDNICTSFKYELCDRLRTDTIDPTHLNSYLIICIEKARGILK